MGVHGCAVRPVGVHKGDGCKHAAVELSFARSSRKKRELARTRFQTWRRELVGGRENNTLESSSKLNASPSPSDPSNASFSHFLAHFQRFLDGNERN